MEMFSVVYPRLLKSSQAKPATELWTIRRAGQWFEVLRRRRTIKLCLDRPLQRNSLSSSMIKEVIEFFNSLSTDDSVDRIVLTGRGKYFCSGMDIKEDLFASPDERYTMLQGLFNAIETSPKTTIAVINGPAFGGGVGLAFACDIRVALSNSFFCLSEWGPGIARMAMLTGRKITPQLLWNVGVIHAVASDPGSLEGETEKFLVEVSGAAPQASAWCKMLVRDADEKMDGVESLSREIFRAMLAEDSESSYGVGQFLAGAKHNCWEELVWPSVSK
ncbi:enoyl-CoA hydratase/isomerase family protein [Diaporthe sp. PMI_573]|nr:enoyl-CoA hydratase/isomerase family protein [Diaporthaceae sp. PMI_573]